MEVRRVTQPLFSKRVTLAYHLLGGNMGQEKHLRGKETTPRCLFSYEARKYLGQTFVMGVQRWGGNAS